MEAKHLEEVNNRQLTERLGLEKAHMSEFSEFTLFWDAKEAEYDENSGLLVLQTRDKHSTELQEYFDELERRFDRPKPSPELLNMRRIGERVLSFYPSHHWSGSAVKIVMGLGLMERLGGWWTTQRRLWRSRKSSQRPR